MRKVAHVTVNGERDVADTAFASLTAYCMQRADVMLPPLCSIMLSTVSTRQRPSRAEASAALPAPAEASASLAAYPQGGPL